MPRFRMICPNCSAIMITDCPETVVWELCPYCRRHQWDLYDVRMADVIVDGHFSREGACSQ